MIAPKEFQSYMDLHEIRCGCWALSYTFPLSWSGHWDEMHQFLDERGGCGLLVDPNVGIIDPTIPRTNPYGCVWVTWPSEDEKDTLTPEQEFIEDLKQPEPEEEQEPEWITKKRLANDPNPICKPSNPIIPDLWSAL